VILLKRKCNVGFQLHNWVLDHITRSQVFATCVMFRLIALNSSGFILRTEEGVGIKDGD
jgi:hypothetical protein